ncbi:alpha carbonic anhydrase, partial [Thamnocephalis sphaerospora]
YNGETGPAYWGKLAPEYSKCNNGRQQSPINLAQTTSDRALGSDRESHTLQLSWSPLHNVNAQHNGHTIQADLSAEATANNTVTFDGKRYSLTQFHIHTPSEHRLDERHFDGELHFVSQSADGQLLVTGILLTAAPRGGTCLLNGIAAQVCGKSTTVPMFDLRALLQAVDNVQERWVYRGSLTTPPCTEGVRWVVAKRPLLVGFNAMAALRAAVGFNARDTMPVNLDQR